MLPLRINMCSRCDFSSNFPPRFARLKQKTCHERQPEFCCRRADGVACRSRRRRRLDSVSRSRRVGNEFRIWTAVEMVVDRERGVEDETARPRHVQPDYSGRSVYITCYSGYGMDAKSPGNKSDLMRHLLCINRADGAIKWKKDFNPLLPESEYSGGNNSWHGYSSSTPTTDGERLYLFLGKSGVYALDLDGNEIWHESVGEKLAAGVRRIRPCCLKTWSSSTPASKAILWWRSTKKNGKKVWTRGDVRGSWNTPLLVETDQGDTELVVSLPGRPEGENRRHRSEIRKRPVVLRRDS